MKFTVEEAYENYADRFGLKLLAGESGLKRELKWVYVAEDYTTSDFLRGGELIISTGVISGGSPDWLLRFLRHMTYQKTSGLILNLGPYMSPEIVTPAVAEYCNSHDYPIFSMPWHTHIYDVTRVLYEQIYLRTRKDEQLNEAFRTLLSESRTDERSIARLKEEGWPESAGYYAAVLEADGSGDLRSWISETVMHQGYRCFPIYREKSCVLICRCDAAPDIVPAAGITVGIGSHADGLVGLYDSARRAESMLRLARQRREPSAVWDESGLCRLLTEVRDDHLLREYCESYLAPVWGYDRQHHSNLSETLRLYLESGCSVQAVAEACFCHRNTINHRLQVLKEVLGYMLDDPSIRFSLQTAFLTEEYLASQK